MTGELTVRAAEPADTEPIARLHERSIRGLANSHYPEAVVSAWAANKDPDQYDIDDSGGTFLIAETDDGMVGFGELRYTVGSYLRSAVEGEIRAVYVDPNAAGEGVGSRILERLEADARSCGIESIGLWASRNAVSFYAVHGFDRVETVTHEFGGEVEAEVVEMRKTL